MLSMTAFMLEGLLFHGQNLAPVLRTYSSDTVQRLYRLFYDENGDELPAAGVHLAISQMVKDGASESLINDALTYAPALPYKSELNLIGGISSFNYYRGQGWIPEPKATDTTQVISLIVHARAILEHLLTVEEDEHPDLPYGVHVESTPAVTLNQDRMDRFHALNDERLVRLLWDRFDDGKRMRRIVMERGNADVDLILSILDSDSPALAEGAL
jgi:hypothetical protein